MSSCKLRPRWIGLLKKCINIVAIICIDLGFFFFFLRSLITDKLCHKINIISFVTSYFMISIIASTARGSLIFLTGRSLVGLGMDYEMSVVVFPLYFAKCSPKEIRSFWVGFYSLIMGLVKVFPTSLKLFEVKYWPLYWWCLIFFLLRKGVF